ncbi:hypothetical protein WDU94_002535 [Cyamophila willieti]
MRGSDGRTSQFPKSNRKRKSSVKAGFKIVSSMPMKKKTSTQKMTTSMSKAKMKTEDPAKEVNNQFMMEDNSDSDEDSMESITSKYLSNISKKKIIPAPPELREMESSNEVMTTACVTLTSVTPLSNVTEPSAIDREFKLNKEILFNLSNTCIYNQSKHGMFYKNINAIRNTLVNYQIKHNIYVKSYDFIMLLSTILLLGGKALHCIIQVNIALLPLYEIAIHVTRFIVEQLAMISQTECNKDKIQMSIMCLLQTMTLILMTLFIYGSVLIPISYIGVAIFWKIVHFLVM